MKFIVSLAFSAPDQLCELARTAEAAGFHSVAVSDHLVHPEKIKTPYPYTDDGLPRWEAFTSWPDPWVTVGALAAVTERLRFLSSVYVLPLRSPFLVAKAVGTAVVLSDNRVTLGIGIGWMKDEFELLGQDFGTRGRRTDEMIEVLRTLWAGGMVEHHGEFYDFDRLEMSPVPSAKVPIYVGGMSPAALRRAARVGDGWISDLHSSEELRKLLTQLQGYREELGNADRPFEICAAVSNAYGIDGYRRLEESGVTELLTQPWLFYGGSPDSLADKRDGILRFGEDIIAKLR